MNIRQQPTAEPLPCPFCGGGAETFHHTPAKWDQSYHIECLTCGCGTCHHETKAEAIAAWNCRPQPTAEPVDDGLVECIRETIMSTDHPVSDWELEFAKNVRALPEFAAIQSLRAEIARKDEALRALLAECRERGGGVSKGEVLGCAALNPKETDDG